MSDVKKPNDPWVTVWRHESEFQQMQAVTAIAVMVGGELGQALEDAVGAVRGRVMERARRDV